MNGKMVVEKKEQPNAWRHRTLVENMLNIESYS